MVTKPSEFGQRPAVDVLAVILLIGLIAAYVWLQAFGAPPQNPPRDLSMPASLH